MTTKQIFDEAVGLKLFGTSGLVFGGVNVDDNSSAIWTTSSSLLYNFRQEYNGSFSSDGSFSSEGVNSDD